MERRLAVFESRVVRNIFGPKRGEMEGDWRRLHKEELSDFCDLYSSIKSRIMRWAVI